MSKIILCTENTTEHSLEAKKHDGVNHFDHHGEFSTNKAPCNNEDIKPITSGDITITHIDADTLVGLCRMMGRMDKVPAELDLDLMEHIDLMGSSASPDKFNPTILWMVVVGAVAQDLTFPRVGEFPIDVTNLVKEILNHDLIEAGRIAQEASEKCYVDCCTRTSNDKGVKLFVIDSADPLDPSRPYVDGYDVVVVYRKHYASISIYASPKSSYEFAGKTFADIEFAGHPKACGSPRGVEMTVEDAEKVYEAVRDSI